MNSSANSTRVDQASLPSASQSQVVSWQSAFWAAATIAINTCLQDCGKVCGIPKAFASLVRTSRVFCLVDTLVILVQVGLYSLKHGIQNAIQMVATDRNQADCESMKQTPSHAIMKGLLLVVACLQLIKLYALQHVIWTQLFGTCFMVSYAANAILNTFGFSSLDFGREPLPPLSKRLVHLTESLAYCSATGQLILLVYALEPVFSAMDWGYSYTLSILWVYLYLFIAFGIIVIPTGVLGLVDTTVRLGPVAIVILTLSVQLRKGFYTGIELLAMPFGAESQTVFLSTSIVLISVACGFRFVVPLQLLDATWQKLNLIFMDVLIGLAIRTQAYTAAIDVLALYTWLVSLANLALTSGFVGERVAARYSAIVEEHSWVYVWFFAANGVCPITWYMTGHTAEGTYKPGWTENLG